MDYCTLNDISFYNTELFGIPTISRVGIRNPSCCKFLDPVENQKKPLFSEANNEHGNITTLKAESGYFYTLAYALEKVANNKIKQILGDDEEKKEDKPATKEKDPKEVTEAVKKFKEDNISNQDLYEVRYSVQPATYYSGKIGEDILKESGFNELCIEDLTSISQIAGLSKKSVGNIIKETANPWRSEKNHATKQGKHAEAVVRLDMLMKLGKIDSDQYEEELFLVDNPPKRTYNKSNKPKVEKIKYDFLTDKAVDTAEMFNMLYCLNAINKDGLFVRFKEEL